MGEVLCPQESEQWQRKAVLVSAVCAAPGPFGTGGHGRSSLYPSNTDDSGHGSKHDLSCGCMLGSQSHGSGVVHWARVSGHVEGVPV